MDFSLDLRHSDRAADKDSRVAARCIHCVVLGLSNNPSLLLLKLYATQLCKEGRKSHQAWIAVVMQVQAPR